MTELDVRTLLISVAALNIVLTIAMVLYWRSQRVYRGFGLWTICNSLMALSYILFFLRGEASPFVTIVAASGVGGFGAVFRLEALRRFFGREHFDYSRSCTCPGTRETPRCRPAGWTRGSISSQSHSPPKCSLKW